VSSGFWEGYCRRPAVRGGQCLFCRTCFRGACEVLLAISEAPAVFGPGVRWRLVVARLIRLRRHQEPEQPDKLKCPLLPHLTADASRHTARVRGGSVCHRNRRNGHAQPDGLRSAPALVAFAARNPSACSPARITKYGCARTPCRRPRAACGGLTSRRYRSFEKAKIGQTTLANFQTDLQDDLLKRIG